MKRFGHICSFVLLALLPGLTASAEEASGGKELTIEEFLQSLSTVQGAVGRKDPFAEFGPPFELNPIEQSSSGADDPNAVNMNVPILERFPIAEYEVVAVLLGDQYPRALLRLPAEGGNVANRKVVIVKERDKLGNRKGVIAKIVLEGVVVQLAQRSAHGFVDKAEVLLKVGAKAEEQKRALVTTQFGSK